MADRLDVLPQHPPTPVDDGAADHLLHSTSDDCVGLLARVRGQG